MKKYIILFVFPVILSGCFKLLNVKDDVGSFKPIKPQAIKINRKDNGSIYQQGMRVGLFEDTNAKYVGDILTIILTESTNASSTSNTNSSKDSKVKLPGPTLSGNKVLKDGVEILNNEFSGERQFSGQGTSSMNSNFNGEITVMVAEVLPNQNLIVRGEKMMLLNQSDEYIRFIGVIRPQDIDQNNTIKSTQVANVHMAFRGKGDLSQANQIGPLAKYFQSQAWPY